MRTQQLTPNLRDEPRTIERAEDAAIAGEIARRLLDMAEVRGRTRTVEFMQKLVSVHLCYPPALWIMLPVMTGDLSEITKTFDERGRDTARSRQAAEQEMDRAITSLTLHFPPLAEAIQSLRNRRMDAIERAEDEVRA